jgi:hypothetical protein
MPNGKRTSRAGQAGRDRDHVVAECTGRNPQPIA